LRIDVGVRDRRRRGGMKALKVRFFPGRPPKLSSGRVRVRVRVRVLLKGAMPRKPRKRLEPMTGLEPVTCGLRNRCSTN
jgi:hypothetical protein